MFRNWKKWVGFLGLTALLFATAGVMAEDRAATSSLPAALTSIGVAADDVVSTTEAHQVRGQGGINHGGNVDWLNCYWGGAKPGCFPPPPPPGNGNGGHNGGNGGGNGYTLTQEMDFSINGVAKGNVTVVEGVIGVMEYKQVNDGQVLKVGATFGGLAGKIGLTDNGLQFQFAGKAIQESFDFVGTYNQNFSQTYTK